VGWQAIDAAVGEASLCEIPDYTHSQVQTILADIGAKKGHDIWLPRSNRAQIDRVLAPDLPLRDAIPHALASVVSIAEEIDVIWLRRGSGLLAALYEVEHTTSIYSGLLRFNDIHLVASSERPTFTIVAKDVRRDVFTRNVQRPTFTYSGLDKLCTFLDYRSVAAWYARLR
jgi:type II restriction enzyme